MTTENRNKNGRTGKSHRPAEYGDGTERLPIRTEVAPCADSIPAAAFRSGGTGARDGRTSRTKLVVMIKKIVIANRGEIAVRVIRSCREMGTSPVALFSEADRLSRHVMLADEAYCIGEAASKESYLNIDRIIRVALAGGADAVHPGYGFLSENADFARRCAEAGLVFIGPRPETIDAMGDKISARRKMIEAGVPVVPGTQENLSGADEAVEACRRIGFPVMLKASQGGGGKGMRLARSEDEVREACRGGTLRGGGLVRRRNDLHRTLRRRASPYRVPDSGRYARQTWSTRATGSARYSGADIRKSSRRARPRF